MIFVDLFVTMKQIFASFSTNSNVFSVMYGLRIILFAVSVFNSYSPLILNEGILSHQFLLMQ